MIRVLRDTTQKLESKSKVIWSRFIEQTLLKLKLHPNRLTYKNRKTTPEMRHIFIINI